MSTPVSRDREALVAAILRATADLAAARVAYAQGVAERHGLAATDVEVLRLLASEGAMPVGRVGELTALTTGATTRLIDRLEQAGFVRRVPDPADRRRVIVEAAADRATAVQQAFDPVDAAATLALGSLDDAALAGVHAYLTACVAALRATPVEQAVADRPASARASVGAPIASATAGRLVFVTGAPTVTIGGSADLGTELYRARFKGAVPSARVRDGMITIRFPRFAWFDWRARVGGEWVNASAHWKRDQTEVQLNALLPWAISPRRCDAVRADLRASTCRRSRSRAERAPCRCAWACPPDGSRSSWVAAPARSPSSVRRTSRSGSGSRAGIGRR